MAPRQDMQSSETQTRLRAQIHFPFAFARPAQNEDVGSCRSQGKRSRENNKYRLLGFVHGWKMLAGLDGVKQIASWCWAGLEPAFLRKRIDSLPATLQYHCLPRQLRSSAMLVQSFVQ